jgi:phospholipid-binding lipoprotein MlaA
MRRGVSWTWRTSALRLCALALGALLTGCATGPQANPADPLEPWNRGVYQFNDAVDRAVLKPVATPLRIISGTLSW